MLLLPNPVKPPATEDATEAKEYREAYAGVDSPSRPCVMNLACHGLPADCMYAEVEAKLKKAMPVF